MSRVSAAALVLILLAGCASQPLYSPASRPDEPGYWETQLTDDRFRVSFVGRNATSSEAVRNYALLRAAELTLASGNDWFEIIDRENDERLTTRGSPNFTVGVGSSCYPFGCPVVGSRWYTGVHMDSRRFADRYRSSIEIRVGKGQPEDPTKVYDARELSRHLRGATGAPLD